ncbi:MAG: hypothetical protein WBP29_07955 [Candidatus Zixiibacteriota bacterium]
MPRRKTNEQHAPIGEKELWHPYELQSLVSRKFVKIVDKILKGEYGLLDTSHCARTLEL